MQQLPGASVSSLVSCLRTLGEQECVNLLHQAQQRANERAAEIDARPISDELDTLINERMDADDTNSQSTEEDSRNI